MNKKEIFAKRFKEECDKLHKSVNQIERELGYSRNALQNYKKGRVPSGVRLLELAEYFGVTPQYLVGEENEDGPEKIRALFNDLSLSKKKELCIICQEWALFHVFESERK